MGLDAQDKLALAEIERHFRPRADQAEALQKIHALAMELARAIVEGVAAAPQRDTALRHLESCLLFAGHSLRYETETKAEP